MIVVDLFLRGGIAMWPVLFCLIVTLMVTVERMAFLRRSHFDGKQLSLKIRSLLSRNDATAAADACTYSELPIARIFKRAIVRFSAGRAEMRAAASIAVREESIRMQQGIDVLASMAIAAPVLGLLGTTINLYLALQAVERLGGTMTVVFMASEIREAMMAGIFGISAGFISFVSYRYGAGRTRERLLECEQSIEELLEGEYPVSVTQPAASEKPVVEKTAPAPERPRNTKTVFSDEDEFFEVKH
jgi:biopolymer transport protein ExbB